MVTIKRIVLDVLKPHHPDCLEFACAIADKSPGIKVELTVDEIDEKTESVIIVIEGESLDYDVIVEVITDLGGSVHSIDEVEVTSKSD